MLTSEVVIAGIVIVMLVLILLILIFKGFGTAVSKGEKKSRGGNAVQSAAPVPAPQAAQSAVAPAPAVQSGISGEIVAAIAAAVYAAEGGRQVAIRSIRVKNVSGRNPWAAAAIADNTRPF